jgi:hypothetical protein
MIAAWGNGEASGAGGRTEEETTGDGGAAVFWAAFFVVVAGNLFYIRYSSGVGMMSTDMR